MQIYFLNIAYMLYALTQICYLFNADMFKDINADIFNSFYFLLLPLIL